MIPELAATDLMPTQIADHNQNTQLIPFQKKAVRKLDMLGWNHDQWIVQGVDT